MRKSKVPSFAFRLIACAALTTAATSCHEGIDTTRADRNPLTLGHDLYGMFCDRLGAGILTEDLTGASYHSICHYNGQGQYGNTVDTAHLPSVKGDAQEARRKSIAKMEALARRRDDLIRAFNHTMPDIEIDNVATEQVGDTIHLHTAMRRLAQTIAPLYDENPYSSGTEPLAPGTTRALGRLFDTLGSNPEAVQALATIWGRQGYRPFNVGLGAIRPALASPNLRSATTALLNVLGPDGLAVPQLQQLLKVAKWELLNAQQVVSPLPTLAVDPATAQPNRIRSNSEFAKALLLSSAPGLTDDPNAPQAYITLRDRRGFAIPSGNTPGAPGTVPAPFADLDGDGFADVDGFGRFVDGAAQPLVLDSPFVIPGIPSGPLDGYGRPATPLYEYVDTNRTVASTLTRRLAPLLDGTQYGTPGDPNAFLVENETLMYAFSGSQKLFGPREPALYDYATNTILPVGTPCETCVDYNRFRGEDSPIPDLVHGFGQVLADQNSDMILDGTIVLLEEHEQVVARLIGAALELRAIAKRHDDLAAQGLEPYAALAYEVPVWDQVAQVVHRMAQHPGLLRDLIGSLGDPVVVTPVDGAQSMGDAMARFAENRDELNYDWNNINGPARNITVGGASTSDPITPVDWNQPITGTNRSALERSMQLIRDVKNVGTCNKQGAKVKANVFGLSVDWPLIGSYDECELFEIGDLAAFYVGSSLHPSHPKKAELVIKSGTLNSLISYLSVAATPDELFEQSSGISGMTLHPDPPALHRLVFFGADSQQFGKLPDHDYTNQGGQTADFIEALIEPIASGVCAKKSNGVNACSNVADVARVRGANTIFLWERLGFLDYLRPSLTAFAEVSCNEAVTNCDSGNFVGENMFVDLVSSIVMHFPGPDHGPECSSSGNENTNPKYCSGAGISNYGPILSESFRSDFIPALHEFSKAAHELTTVTIKRGPNAGQTLRGSEVLEIATRILFDQSYAASPDASNPGVPMMDRFGNSSALWVDGRTQDQLTPYTLISDALHDFDMSFTGEDGEYRKSQWRRARSQIVDEFFAVEGSGPNAQFKNPSTVPMLLAVLRLTREQLNAHCPDREFGARCNWAREDMSRKVAEVLSDPLFAAIVDLQEAIRVDEPARREMQRYVSYLLQSASGNDAQQSMLASVIDLMQVLSDDDAMTPIFRAAATASNPGEDPAGAGCADRTITLMKALVDPKYDKYQALDHVMRNLVTPMTDETGAMTNVAPIEIFIDTIAEVHRIDAAVQGPLTPEDYQAIMFTVRDFFMDDKRGLEQFYTIVSNRHGD